jgi:beta-propeller repeat-containing protein
VDRNGNVFVTGSSPAPGTFNDYATIAYSAAGVALWTNRYNGPANSGDGPSAMAVNRNGNVFVTGESYGGAGSISDYATVAYSAAGVALWTNRYDGPDGAYDSATAVAVDNAGNVFVTGQSGGPYFGYLTIAYSGAGVAIWTNSYSSGAGYNSPSAIAADGKGNVFVTGDSWGGGASNSDYATVAYSGAGVALWTNRYNGPGSNQDFASAVAVDTSGNIFVTGYSVGSESNYDYATIAYSGAGVALSTNRYNGPANGEDVPASRVCLAIGPGGAVYVTGRSDGNYGSDVVNDYATVKYILQPHLAIEPFTAGSSSVNLKLSGAPGSSWSIERAPMIAGPWTNLGSSLIGANGLGLLQDTSPPAKGAFYRATQP